MTPEEKEELTAILREGLDAVTFLAQAYDAIWTCYRKAENASSDNISHKAHKALMTVMPPGVQKINKFQLNTWYKYILDEINNA